MSFRLDLANLIDESSSENNGFEDSIKEQVQMLKSDQKNMTTSVNNEISQIRGHIEEYEAEAKQADADLRKQVKASLDNFDFDLASKRIVAHQVATAN